MQSTPVQIAAKFLDARDSLRRMFPEHWQRIVAPQVGMLRRVMAHDNLNAVEAFVALGPSVKAVVPEGTDRGAVVFAMMAAVAEILEPTP